MGKLLNAYKRTGLIGKVGFWGSLASLVSLLIMFAPQNSSSQSTPEPQIRQDGEGGQNQAIIIQGNDNKVSLPNDKNDVAELVKILELRREEVNQTIKINIKLLDKNDADFMLQFQEKYNNLMRDILRAETKHEFILAHEITIRIHQLGHDLTERKNRIYKVVGDRMAGSCPSVFCFDNHPSVRSIDAIVQGFESVTDLLREDVKTKE